MFSKHEGHMTIFTEWTWTNAAFRWDFKTCFMNSRYESDNDVFNTYCPTFVLVLCNNKDFVHPWCTSDRHYITLYTSQLRSPGQSQRCPYAEEHTIKVYKNNSGIEPVIHTSVLHERDCQLNTPAPQSKEVSQVFIW
jgi:hypothetical protein